ncbi:unnamed protein product [Cuscuta campestris]|uniref:BSD domain-containing protein n=1 Tax=Cuscuta campestris TaxID=132261 RepID=A0A484NCC6_9ASTE|nr:unnamed protein product [Cuscuta campestris]
MSWLARSIANSLRLEDDEHQVGEHSHRVSDRASTSEPPEQHAEGYAAYEDVDLDDRSENEGDDCSLDHIHHPGRGVKNDLSELGEALSRQLWGVASFLAPPPPRTTLLIPNSDQLGSDRVHSEPYDRAELSGESEEGEDGENVECENFTEYEEEEDVIGNAVGVTEEALAFAQNIAHHPETWLDFPLSEDEEFDDFEICDTQLKHAFAIECLAPRLAALRVELCPAHMSKGYFWMVYFVLLHSRLNKHDAELLSSPQLVQARAMWIKELQKKTKPESDWFGFKKSHSKESTDFLGEESDSFSSFSETHTNIETEKHPLETTPEIQFIDKAVIAEDLESKEVEKVVVTTSSYEVPVSDYDNDDDGEEDDWLKDTPELEGYSCPVLVGDEVSFSDLEDDIDDCTVPSKPKGIPKVTEKLDSTTSK